MRLHSVKSYAANTKAAKQAESVVQISEDNEPEGSVQVLDRTAKGVRELDIEAEIKDLRAEMSKMKEEKCILINKLFSTSSKYEHLKKVSSQPLPKQNIEMAKKFNKDINDIKEPKKQD